MFSSTVLYHVLVQVILTLHQQLPFSLSLVLRQLIGLSGLCDPVLGASFLPFPVPRCNLIRFQYHSRSLPRYEEPGENLFKVISKGVTDDFINNARKLFSLHPMNSRRFKKFNFAELEAISILFKIMSRVAQSHVMTFYCK